jgi:hypothetical protein
MKRSIMRGDEQTIKRHLIVRSKSRLPDWPDVRGAIGAAQCHAIPIIFVQCFDTGSIVVIKSRFPDEFKVLAEIQEWEVPEDIRVIDLD